jgi:hypothetical protein
MSYSEENGQVVLRMSRGEYEWLIIMLRSAAENFGVNRVTDLCNRLTPYQVPEKKP